MDRPGATPRVILSALFLAAPVLRADPPAAVPAPRADPRKTAPQAEDPIKKACDGEAVAVRLSDPALPEGVHGPPAPRPDRAKEAQAAANRLGAGVEAEFDANGQTLSWTRGRTTKRDCQTRLRRVQRDFSGRVTFEPTTAERVEEVRRRRDALIPEAMRKNAATADVGGFFDGSTLVAAALNRGAGETAAPRVAATALDAAAAREQRPAAPAADAPGRQLPVQYRGTLSSPPPTFVSYEPPSFSRSLSDAWTTTRDAVSSGIARASEYLGGVARSVQNRFYSGIEMIQGYGYKMIRAWRGSNWGTKPLVDGLRSIAAYMRGGGKAQTDLAIGDISSANGGQLGGHASHKTGRDVDIGYYMTDAKTGQPVEGEFVRFNGGRDGLTGWKDGRAVRFDAERNWMLVQAILANPDPAFKPVYIFIDAHLERAVLLAAGDAPEKARASELMRPWPGHDNHLHLRVQ